MFPLNKGSKELSMIQDYLQNKDLPIKKWLCGSISRKNFHPMLNNHQQPLQWGKNTICSMHLCNKLLASGEELNISLYAKIMWSYEFRIFFKMMWSYEFRIFFKKVIFSLPLLLSLGYSSLCCLQYQALLLWHCINLILFNQDNEFIKKFEIKIYSTFTIGC